MKQKIQCVFTAAMLGIFASLFLPKLSIAQEDGSPVSIGNYRMLHSKILNEDRTLLVNLPEGYEESTMHYPVLYVLYGGQVKGYFAESVHIVNRLSEAGLIPQLIIIGVKKIQWNPNTICHITRIFIIIF